MQNSAPYQEKKQSEMTQTPLAKNSNHTVLIIDDSYDNRVLLSSQLHLEGYQTLQASGGQEGLSMAREHDPDIILLDVMMPDMSGFEVCKHLKTDPTTQVIPVIMVTALRAVEKRIEGKTAGADDFLSRPYYREELLVRVQTLIKLKHTRVNLEEERNRLQLLYHISQSISENLDITAMMSKIIMETQKALGATKGNILLIDDNQKVTNKFLSRANYPLKIGDRVATDVMTKGLGGWLIKNNRGDYIDNIRKDDRWITLPDDQEETGSAIGVPLSKGELVLGVLILNHPQIGYFTEDHLSLLKAIAGTITAAIQNANLFSKVEEEREKLSAILAQASDAVIITDEEKNITLFNKTAEKLFQVQEENLFNRKITDIENLWPLISLFDNPKLDSYADEVTVKNNRVLYASLSRIHGVGFAIVMQDITEMKRMEEIRLEREREEKEQVRATFERYMGPRLIEHVLNNAPNLMARRERRQAVVMFADIRNYTQFTRLIQPNDVVERLNKFFTTMTEVVYSFDGIIFELTGDEILVGFNAPFDQNDAATRALETAVSMQRHFNRLRQELFEGLSIGFGMGVGIDQGEVVLGNVGAETRMTYRMVGYAVNMAHRLVDLALDRQIVISQSVHENLNFERPVVKNVDFVSMGPVEIKGRDKPATVYHTTILDSAL